MQVEMKHEAYRVEELMKATLTTCFARCVNTFSQSELTDAEATCVDGCCAKFFSPQRILAASLNRAGIDATGAPDQTKKRK